MTAPENPRRSLTVPEAAAWLGVSPATVRRQIRAGRLEAYPVGEGADLHHYRIPAAAVERRLGAADRGRTGGGEAGWPGQAKRIRQELEAIALTLRALTEHVRAVEDALDADEGEV